MKKLLSHIKNKNSNKEDSKASSTPIGATHSHKQTKKSRLVQKCGELNIHMNNVPKHKRRLLSDFFNTILDIKWRWHLLVFMLSFLVSWLIFALIWYAVAFAHGDLHVQNFNSSGQEPCVYGVHDFTSAFLYSIETQHTIGYGHRHITQQCPFAIMFLMLQSCFGIFVQGLVAGVVFAKLSRPNKRRRTIIFSNNACISNRDGKLCFMFKIGNIRISQLSDAKIKLLMIRSRYTSEGEYIPFQTFNMKIGQIDGNDNVFFPWPQTIEHIIDEASPLFDIYLSTLTASDLNQSLKCDNFEIVVILEGNIETTGASCHIRTSYLPNEVLWGYRFTPINPKFNQNNDYLFDYSKFNHVEQVQDDLTHINSILNSYPNATTSYSHSFATQYLKSLIFNDKSNKKANVKNIFNNLQTTNDYSHENNRDSLLGNRFTVVTVTNQDEGYLTCDRQ